MLILPSRKVHKWVLAGFTCKPSLVNGAAFITNPSVALSRFVGHKFSLSDGSNSLVGWGYTAGTGETLGDELITGWTNWAAPNAFETLTVNANGHDLTAVVNSAGYGIADTNQLGGAGYLLKWVWDTTVTASDDMVFQTSTDTAATASGEFSYTGPPVDKASYFTVAAARYLTVYVGTPGTTNHSALHSCKQVLTPSPWGISIVNALGSTTRNWASGADVINPNATSFTLTISAQ